ncbi:MAG: DUF1273 family protein [Clostridia bacterium]|nr:DUF1273 family protein [Clostridia bacterium]
MEKAICFTGHRDMQSEDKVKIQLYSLVEEYIKEGYTTFLAGGARGFDNLAAEVVANLREKYPQVKLVIALPFPSHYRHEKNWNSDEIKTYKQVLKNADEVVTLFKEYKSGAYFKRNRYLVDNTAICIAYYRRNGSGTAYTVNYANACKKKVINLAQ